MAYIYKKSGRKFFLTRGSGKRQSEANHEHRGDIANKLEENPLLIDEKLAQIMNVIEDWKRMLNRYKAYKTIGYTFYVYVDNTITIDVVSGIGEENFGRSPRVYKSLKSLLKYFLARDEARKIVNKKQDHIYRQLNQENGNIKVVARKLGIRPEFVKIFYNDCYTDEILEEDVLKKVNAYEVGLKSRFADNKVQLNLAGFYYQYLVGLANGA